MGSLAVCARCRRTAPKPDAPESLAWDLLLSDEGEVVALVCPACLTATELRLREEDTQALIKRVKRNHAWE